MALCVSPNSFTRNRLISVLVCVGMILLLFLNSLWYALIVDQNNEITYSSGNIEPPQNISKKVRNILMYNHKIDKARDVSVLSSRLV